MQYKKIDSTYLIRIDLDEELITSLLEFCQKEKISSGFFHGLGGAKNATLGYFDLDSKEYVFRNFNNLVEIVSLNGNITLKDGEPFIHAHGAFGNKDFETFSGHIQSLTIGGTAEIFLTPLNEPIVRTLDTETGLNLFNL